MRNHTQINPEFIYTFTALHCDRMADDVTTVHIAADTLVDARRMVKGMGYVAAFLKGRKENHLIATASRGYDLPAPHKTGAGIGVLVFNEAHNTRPACFFVPDSHTLSMVGCMGAEQSAPGSSLTGYANPVQSTASEIGVSCGGFINPNEEASTMATVPSPVHSQTTFIWRFIVSGTSEPRIIHVTVHTEREARNRCPSGCVVVFAARIRKEVSHA